MIAVEMAERIYMACGVISARVKLRVRDNEDVERQSAILELLERT